jgi:hypothetical protein
LWCLTLCCRRRATVRVHVQAMVRSNGAHLCRLEGLCGQHAKKSDRFSLGSESFTLRCE